MSDRRADHLAVDGGAPVRSVPLAYAKQTIDDEDVACVARALRSDFLTTGPEVEAFETDVARYAGASEGVAASSGTAALHVAMLALGVQPGDEVIVPPLTFAASANAILYVGATPVFADVDPQTLLLDPREVERKISARTRAIIAVDYAGQPCDYAALRAIASTHSLALVADACHSLGAVDADGRRAGNLADITALSFHPVKHVTTAEGGMLTTNDPELAKRMRMFRAHGIAGDHRRRAASGTWFYEMVELGYNYRLSDLQCALGRSQLARLDGWLERRRSIARAYDRALSELTGVRPVARRGGVHHAFHLYPVLLDLDRLRADRKRVYEALRAEGIGVNVHYVPVHLHPYYRKRFGYSGGELPIAEAAYERLLSLPLFPRMTDGDVSDVLAAMSKVLRAFVR